MCKTERIATNSNSTGFNKAKGRVQINRGTLRKEKCIVLTFPQIQAKLAPLENNTDDQLLLEGQAVDELYQLSVD